MKRYFSKSKKRTKINTMRMILSLALLCFLVGCNPSDKNKLSFERVVDGDTFIASGKRIRIWGIDSPEKNEPLSETATMYLEVLIEDKILECTLIDVDRYKRDVMRCYVGRNDIAADMVRMGMAKDYRRYSRGYYEFEEALAKAENMGIWSK